MDDKYADLRAALPDLVEEARRKGGTNPRAQMIIDLLADYDRMRDALTEMVEVAERVDGWQSFPQVSIDKAKGAIGGNK